MIPPKIGVLLLLIGLAVTAPAQDSNRLIILSKPEQPATSFAVYLPETVDTVQERYNSSDSRQQVAQGVIENSLIRSGYRLVNLELVTGGLPASASDALKKAREANVDYLVVGHARATQAGSSSPGLAIVTEPMRSSAAISAQVVKVGDGSVLIAKEVSSGGSAASQVSAGQGALRDAANQLAAQLLSSLSLQLKD